MAMVGTMKTLLDRKTLLSRGPVLLLGLVAVCAIVKVELSGPLLYRTLRGEAAFGMWTELYVPPSLDEESQRALSLDLGGGNCKWQPPAYDVDEAVDYHKTLIAGFPSGDKRMIFVQMEALTGLPAKDEWDFEFLGDSNHPFIKANYPHHEGIWGWGSNADQVVMMVRNIRKSMVEYHDILWDIGYAKTWEEATLNLDNLYSERPPPEDFYEWRDERVIDEIDWYGWFIDYWMEGGLLRDIFTHKITTLEHWNMLMMPTVYTRAELDYDLIVGADTVVTPAYDPHCANGEVSDGCEPKAVISAEKLRLPSAEGKEETAAIANVLLNDDRMGQHVIAQQAWNCIWRELIENGKGLKTVYDRPGAGESDYSFSDDMLDYMIVELDRLINKYSEAGSKWESMDTAGRLVELLSEHKQLVQQERQQGGPSRQLRDQDFLGPKERARRRKMKRQEKGEPDAEERERKDYSKYFQNIEQKMAERKLRDMKHLARKVEAERKQVELERKLEKLSSDVGTLGFPYDSMTRMADSEPARGDGA